MPRVARRIADIRPSVFSEFSALAHRHQAVNFGQGVPNLPWPEALAEAARDALEHGHNQYGVSSGAAELRSAIAEHARRFYDMPVDPDTMVCVTNGATEAILDAVLALVDPGDEVVIFEPFFDSYRWTVSMAGGTARYVLLRPPDGAHARWWFDADELASAFSDRTSLVLLNTPHNPTGKVFTEDELAMIADLCQKHDAIVLSDEVYEHLVFPPARHRRIACLPGMDARTVTVSGAGKTFNLTGWRVGWTIAAPELCHAIQMVHQYATFSAPSPLQHAVATGLSLPEDHFRRFVDDYVRRRDWLAAMVDDAGLHPHPSDGTFFIMVDVSAAGFDDDLEFCRYLTAEVGVAVIPPSFFYSDDHRSHARSLARFAFCKTDDVLALGAQRLGRLRAGGRIS